MSNDAVEIRTQRMWSFGTTGQRMESLEMYLRLEYTRQFVVVVDATRLKV